MTWNIQLFDELHSTQTLAKEQLLSGKARHGDVFIARHQTGGRGRYENRQWLDEPGMNLLMSVILTEVPEHLQSKIQFVSSLAVYHYAAKLLEQFLKADDGRIRFKWSNDILLDGKKLAGVLAETVWSGDKWKGAVVGIGMNINQINFSTEITRQAISLRQVIHRMLDIEMISEGMLNSLDMIPARYPTDSSLINDLREALEWMRTIEHISLTEPDGTNHTGLRYDGITSDGGLITVLPDGGRRIFQNATLDHP